MKRMFALMLAAVMLLCGCSAATGSPEDTRFGELFSNIFDKSGNALKKEAEPLLELGKGEKHNSLMILKVTVNPEFELYVDMEGCVSRVRCLNEDAAAAFQNMTDQGIHVIGKAYSDAMKIILENLTVTGFLTAETGRIRIETTVHVEMPEDELAALTTILAEPVEEYSAENDLAVTVEAPVPEVDTDVEVELPEYDEFKGEPNSERTLDIVDQSGNQVGIHTEYYNENGIKYKDEYRNFDGSYQIYEYAPNGCKTRFEMLTTEGFYQECHFNEYEIEISRADKYPDGTRREVSYHENGNPSIEIYSNSDGTGSETHYDKSGTTICSKSIDADGSINETTFYETGNRKSTIYDGPDGHFEWHYFEDGTQSRYVEDSSQGYHETVYYPGGQVAASIGSYGERRYDESGKLTYDKYTDDFMSYLFENGALVYLIQDGREATPEELKAFAMAMGLLE